MTDRAELVTLIRNLVAFHPEGWDGYGARAVDPLAIERACVVAGLLPADIPDPIVSVDPDGDISLDWDYGNKQILSLSIPGDGQSFWALMVVQHGAFDGERLPRYLLDTISALARMPYKLNGE